jgi:site-specific recombinase XerD
MTAVVARREREGGGGELVDAFDERALAIAAMAASPNTRRAYATAYRAFAGFLRARYGEASKDTVTIASVAAWRDELAARGLAPSSVMQRVSAVRRLAATLGADPLVQQVRCTHVQRDEPRALSDAELDRLLRRPDRRTVIGIRDRAILELLARAGLRRAELARLTVADIQERGRQSDARRRSAIARGRAEQTRLEVVVRASKRGRTRTVPLHAEAHDALARWYASRPTSTSDALFVSLRQRRSAPPQAISASAVGDVVAKHAAGAAIREDRRTAHALRHTFCTMLAERGVALEVIRELAGHVDVRTTQIYVDVTDQRKNEGIAALERGAHPLAG